VHVFSDIRPAGARWNCESKALPWKVGSINGEVSVHVFSDIDLDRSPCSILLQVRNYLRSWTRVVLLKKGRKATYVGSWSSTRTEGRRQSWKTCSNRSTFSLILTIVWLTPCISSFWYRSYTAMDSGSKFHKERVGNARFLWYWPWAVCPCVNITLAWLL